MIRNRIRHFAGFMLLFLSGTLYSYSQATVKNISTRMYNTFDAIYGIDNRLVSGEFYYGTKKGSIKGHPFLDDNSWEEGMVQLEGLRFENLLLKYDIETDKIILKYISGDNKESQIALAKKRVDYFRINNRIFTRVPGTGLKEEGHFYELLSDGKLSFLLMHTKTLVPTNGTGMTNYKYSQKSKQYFLLNNELIPFRSVASIYKFFPSYKKEMKEYIKSSGLKSGSKNIGDRIKIVNYFNQLISD